ncbi:baseplate J/gp47 family protein [Bacillus sp. FJAT-45350]|uniref:baseplate J/gp47 family protein n=1 Tax=Bacillus sp. FJAT-45350 TaxID=2011014 RepID=UPI000BB9B8A1|nr:baseplate J/gp47 family protein [Bacillus sp. FJAT-45350]
MPLKELPPFLEEWAYESLLEDILSYFPDSYGKEQGEFAFNIASPIAVKLSEALQQTANEILLRAFAMTSYGPYLEMKLLESGTEKRRGERSTVSLFVTGRQGTTFSVGNIVSTLEDENREAVEFRVTETTVIGETKETFVPLEAVEIGTNGNVPANTIEVLVTPITGVTSLTNIEAATGGVNEESDEAYLERHLQRARERLTSGNDAQYRSWANEVDGVGRAIVKRRKYGRGTVSIAIVDNEGNPADRSLLNRVQDYIAPGYKININDPEVKLDTDISIPLTINEEGYWFVKASVRIEDEDATGDIIKIYFTDSEDKILKSSLLSEEEATYILNVNDVQEREMVFYFVADSKENNQVKIEPLLETEVYFRLEYIQSVFDDEEHDGVAPVDHRVFIERAETSSLIITATVQLSGISIEKAISEFSKGLDDYLSELIKNEETKIVRTVIGGILSNVGGVTDYEQLLLNGESENIIIDTQQIPKIEVILSE